MGLIIARLMIDWMIYECNLLFLQVGNESSILYNNKKYIKSKTDRHDEQLN